MAVKIPTDLLPVDICYINAIKFYQNLVQFNTVAFMTNLYEINQLIKEKEILVCDQFNKKENECTNKELVDQKLPYWY